MDIDAAIAAADAAIAADAAVRLEGVRKNNYCSQDQRTRSLRGWAVRIAQKLVRGGHGKGEKAQRDQIGRKLQVVKFNFELAVRRDDLMVFDDSSSTTPAEPCGSGGHMKLLPRAYLRGAFAPPAECSSATAMRFPFKDGRPSTGKHMTDVKAAVAQVIDEEIQASVASLFESSGSFFVRSLMIDEATWRVASFHDKPKHFSVQNCHSGIISKLSGEALPQFLNQHCLLSLMDNKTAPCMWSSVLRQVGSNGKLWPEAALFTHRGLTLASDGAPNNDCLYKHVEGLCDGDDDPLVLRSQCLQHGMALVKAPVTADLDISGPAFCSSKMMSQCSYANRVLDAVYIWLRRHLKWIKALAVCFLSEVPRGFSC